MSQLNEFFSNIFSTADWPPRWECGYWSDFHGWLYILSDVGIWLAYFIIPVILIWFVQKKPNLPFLPVFWLFGAFIILCGATHILDAIIFWWPGYRLSAILRFVTAVVSFITVFALIRDLPKVLNLTDGSQNKNDVNNDMNDILAEKNREIQELKMKLAEIEGN